MPDKPTTDIRKKIERVHTWISMAYGVTVGTGTKTDSLDVLLEEIIKQEQLALLERLEGGYHNIHPGFGKCVPLKAVQQEKDRIK